MEQSLNDLVSYDCLKLARRITYKTKCDEDDDTRRNMRRSCDGIEIAEKNVIYLTYANNLGAFIEDFASIKDNEVCITKQLNAMLYSNSEFVLNMSNYTMMLSANNFEITDNYKVMLWAYGENTAELIKNINILLLKYELYIRSSYYTVKVDSLINSLSLDTASIDNEIVAKLYVSKMKDKYTECVMDSGADFLSIDFLAIANEILENEKMELLNEKDRQDKIRKTNIRNFISNIQCGHVFSITSNGIKAKYIVVDAVLALDLTKSAYKLLEIKDSLENSKDVEFMYLKKDEIFDGLYNYSITSVNTKL